MMEKHENIDELFRDRLTDYAPVPPAEVWGRIEHDLVRNRKKIYFPVFLKVAASVVLLAGLSWLLWNYFNSTKEEAVFSKTINIKSPDINSESDITIPEEVAVSTTKNISEQNNSENPISSSAEIAVSKNANEIPDRSDATETALLSEEFTVPDDAIPPGNSHEILVNTFASELSYPVIKQYNTEVDPNDLIMQQNILSLESQKKSNRKNGLDWSVGGQAGPQYTYRDVYVNTPAYPVDNYDNYESGLLAYSGGLDFKIEPAKRFSIQSGVYYSKIGQTKSTLQVNSDIGATWYNEPIEILDPPQRGSSHLPDVVNSTGSLTFDKNISPPVQDNNDIEWTVGVITAEQYFEYVEIPFIFRYLIIDRKINVNLCSGLWANFLVGNKAVATDNATFTTKGETEDINAFGYSGSVSVGLEYPLARNIDINLEPFFKYYLSPINSNPETSVYPYSIGVLTGISYSF